MQRIRGSLLAATLVAALAFSTSALASDREAGPRGGVDKSPIARFIRFVIHALGDVSIPPG